MFFIFKIFPVWFWWLLVLLGLSSVILSRLPQLKSYAFILKNLGLLVVAVGIFINGMVYADGVWKQAAAELEAKVVEAEAKSNTVNETIKEKVVYKIQTIKTRGSDIINYIDREVVKSDVNCVVPQEFVQAHNRATEPPK